MSKVLNPVPVLLCDRPGVIPDAVFGADRPYVIKGLVSDWPLVNAALGSDSAAVDYLKQFYTDRTVVFYEAPAEKNGRFFYSKGCDSLEFESGYARLDQILDRVLSVNVSPEPPTVYVGSTTVDTCLPGLRSANDLDLGDRNPLVSIWLGNQSRVAAHFDAPDNIACCVAGKRRFTLFPTEQVENLYVGPIDFTPSGQPISMVDFNNPDLDAFPRFETAAKAGFVAELEPGDAIYIPSMWWHHVESLSSFNGLVNYWWRDAPNCLEAPMTALHHALMSIRDLPERERMAWKSLFDFYVFGSQEGKHDHIPENARGFLSPMDEGRVRQLRAWLLNKLNR